MGCLHALTVSRDKRILTWTRRPSARPAHLALRAHHQPPRVSSAAQDVLIMTRAPSACARCAHVASTTPQRTALAVATSVLQESICPLAAAARSMTVRPARWGSLPLMAPLLVNPVLLERQTQIMTQQRSAARAPMARMPAVAASLANRVSPGAVMATVTRRPRARCATQGSSGSNLILPILHRVHPALPAKWMPTLTAKPNAKTAASASTVARAPSLPCCAQILMRSTTTTIHQHHV